MAFQKGHKLATGRPKGSLNKETLTKLERRAIFDKEISQKWEEIIRKLKPEYAADQFMGPVKQKIEHSGEVKDTVTEELLALAKEELKKRLKNG